MKVDMEERRPTILVVDDEHFSQRILTDTLEKGGFEVAVASDGKTAVAKTKLLRPDLILLDVVMPGQDGFGTCREIRETSFGSSIPILMATGRGDTASIHAAFEAGATDFIPKPIHPDLLLHRVRYILRANSALRELQANEARLNSLKQAIDTLSIGITTTDLEGRILYANPAEAEMHGYTTTELEAANVRCLAPDRLWDVSARGPENIRVWKRESVNVRKNGEEFPVYLCSHLVKDAEGCTTGIVTSCEDITARKEAEEKIHRLAFHDSLTGLPNRALCTERLNQALASAKAEGHRVGLLFLDLDNFKDINDAEGHDFGDLLLQEVATRLSAVVRQTDILARLGGDELVIVLTAIEDLESITAAAQRTLSAFAAPFSIRGRSMYTSASIGIAVYPDDGFDRETLFRCADTAMYEAKKETSKYRFFCSEMNVRLSRRVAMINGLREGIQGDQFFLLYQPQWDLTANVITGVEALVRWQHPELGLLSPREFLPLIEKTRDICILGEWIIERACMQVAEWNAAGHRLKMAVNVSGQQLKHPGFVEAVGAILARTGILPDQLEIEFTESVLMEKADVLETLRSLKKLGVNLAIDDFGTGYSSLSYLKHFAVDTIKIDQSFIQEVVDNPDDAAIVEAILMMARRLKLKVVAEGVETRDQLSFLAGRNCRVVQGFFFSRPLTPEQIFTNLQMPLPMREELSAGNAVTAVTMAT